jgi:hypothetical protein
VGVISLILPFWNRHAATDKALRLMAQQYARLDLEIVIVDDGSDPPYFPPDGLPLVVRVYHMPAKDQPRNSCVPINYGVDASRGEYIALSSPEMLHTSPVLHQMREEIVRGGPSTYVLAAVWCAEQKMWHCHSTRKHSDVSDVGSFLPKGAGYHFMSMMTRLLWEQTGGFDTDYREGAGYDDPDFVMRLARAGARFVIRDDLVIEHPKAGARSNWTPAMFQRNRDLFFAKWRTH